jgi:carbon-monoxide dehydrogenase large subunit
VAHSDSADRNGWVGQSIPRREDDRLLHGRGLFVADLVDQGTLAAVFVRSMHAHADISGIDITRAAALPGVHLVATAADLQLGPLPLLHVPDPTFAAATGFSMVDPRLPCLAADKVSYVGQPVAVVVATDRHTAEDAAELVDIAYGDLDPVLDPRAALDDGAPLIHPHLESNLAARIGFRFGDVDAALAGAAVVVQRDLAVGRHAAMPMECRGVLARPEPGGRIDMVTSSQIPHRVREAVCSANGLDESAVRVRVVDVGGGFGGKANVYAEEAVVLAAARRLDRAVAWIEDRAEHLVSAAHGRDQRHQCRLAVAADGEILALQDDFVIDLGAGSLWTAGILANTAIHLLGPYRVPAVEISGTAAFTTKTIVAQYRGAGRPEACFALERCLDAAAAALGMSPIDIRRRNLLTARDLPYPRPIPYRDGVPISYDGVDYLAVQDAAVDLVPPQDAAEFARSHPDLKVGHGVANYIEATGRGPYETATVSLSADGRFTVTAGSASSGQSHETVWAQIAADALGVPPDRIDVHTGDTDAVPDGIGTFASRSAVVAGSAIHLAAGDVVDQARDLFAKDWGCAKHEIAFDAGLFRATPDGPAGGWDDLAGALGEGGSLAGAALPSALHRYHPTTVTWTMGCHSVIVGVDPDTGLCRVFRYGVAHEGGLEINPTVVLGQVQGGVAQGLGGALLEELRYADSGQPEVSTLADYPLIGPVETPDVLVRHLQAVTEANPLGVRGAGESGTIPVYAAIAAAIDDALGCRTDGVAATPIVPGQVARLAAGGRP